MGKNNIEIENILFVNTLNDFKKKLERENKEKENEENKTMIVDKKIESNKICEMIDLNKK
jgi:hypothetical protein